MTTQARPIRRSFIRLTLLAASPVALGVIGYHLHTQAAGVDVKACVEENMRNPLLPDYWLLAASIVALLVGRVFGPRIRRTGERRGAQQVSGIVGILATMLFFASIGAALVYEAVGVRVSQARLQQPAEVQQLEPITHYARCAIYYDLQSHWEGWRHTGLWSVFAVGLICFLVGYWLWSLRTPRAPEEQPGGVAESGLPWPAAILIALAVGAVFLYGALYFLNTWIDGTPVVMQLVTGGTDTGASFRDGIRAVIAFVFVGFVIIAALDFVFAFQKWTPIAVRMQDWSRANPWFVFALLLIIGALLTHFIANLIHYPMLSVSGPGLELSTFLESDVLAIVLFGLVVITASIAPRTWRPLRMRHAALTALRWNVAFIAAYTAALVLASVLIARWLTSQVGAADANAVSTAGLVFAALTVVGGGANLVEDGALLQPWARVAAGAATAKFTLLSLVVAFVLAGAGLILGQIERTTFGG